MRGFALALLAGALGLGATQPESSPLVELTSQQDPTRPPGFGRAGEGDSVSLLPGDDPLAAPVAVQRLTATVVTPGESFAVVDGRKVEEGDDLADGRVVRIDPAGVQVEGSAGLFELRFFALPVKAPVATQLAPEAEQP